MLELLLQSPSAKMLWDTAWLNVSAACLVDVLRAAPTGERIRINPGSLLKGIISCPRPVTLSAFNVHLCGGCLQLHNATSSACGTVEGLQMSNYSDSAVMVTGGGNARHGTAPAHWELRHCEVTSSRRTARSYTGIIIREGGSLNVVSSLISNTVHAVGVQPCNVAPCRLMMTGCSIVNTKAAIVTMGGARISVDTTNFSTNGSAFLLDDLVTGRARNNVVDGSMFGKWEKPCNFFCHDNICACRRKCHCPAQLSP